MPEKSIPNAFLRAPATVGSNSQSLHGIPVSSKTREILGVTVCRGLLCEAIKEETESRI